MKTAPSIHLQQQTLTTINAALVMHHIQQKGNMAAELFAKYSCTNCQEEILGVTVHCSECEDFSLCLQCFAAGAEIGPHKNDHSYQFTDTNLATTVSRGKNVWSPREKLRLLDAIEIYSFGNWEDISKHIETRSAEDSKEEYINKYLNGAIGRHTWLPATEHRPQLVDHTVDDKGPLSQLLTQRLPPLDVTPKEAAELQYMPNRNDFEREYDPSAEQLVSTLSICPDDDEADIAIKLAQVDIYVRRLRERTRRKRLVRDYQLIFNFFRGNLRRKQSKDQREFRDRFRVFAQFFTAMEFDRRIGSFEREKALRVRLSELCRYRWNGLQRLEECVHFEQHAASIHKNTGPYGLQGRTLACIIGPNGQRMPGCIRQCLTGQPSQWRTAPVVYALSSKKGRRKRKNRKLKFHRPKIHAPHRRPGLLRRLIAQQKLLG
ncbi:transcriptional adapter 2B isoform X2 [Bradysia coprophila]|uniref:transcriptional adapter 2B isoform X2 n=1 Tax=Bradysia coprophila TaxID=38358 RepID=UPI00187DCC67|nr:transcriptional adapter 2B isoform X2 [Bradysia coprophila]